ncbi:hypothetical protein JHK82_042071 [Glycine max]|nr:hypothetical protein JHK82_042071 [Glycine max]
MYENTHMYIAGTNEKILNFKHTQTNTMMRNNTIEYDYDCHAYFVLNCNYSC